MKRRGWISHPAELNGRNCGVIGAPGHSRKGGGGHVINEQPMSEWNRPIQNGCRHCPLVTVMDVPRRYDYHFFRLLIIFLIEILSSALQVESESMSVCPITHSSIHCDWGREFGRKMAELCGRLIDKSTIIVFWTGDFDSVCCWRRIDEWMKPVPRCRVTASSLNGNYLISSCASLTWQRGNTWPQIIQSWMSLASTALQSQRWPSFLGYIQLHLILISRLKATS